MGRRWLTDHAPIAAIAVVWFLVLWWTAPAVGYTRDEGYYFKAAEEYAGWWDVVFSERFFDAFTDAEIVRHFSYNTEHPALVKLSQGITHRVFHGWLGVAGPAQGFRASGFLFSALAVLATFLLGRRVGGPAVGLVAALLLMSMPRPFFDAHLACFDVAMMAMWTLALWAFLRAYEAPGARAHVVAGVVFGLALATKLNGFFLPFVFVAAWLVDRGALSGLRLEAGPSGAVDLRLPRLPWVLVVCAILGPIVFYLHWPYLWHEPVKRFSSYVGFHLHHEHYPALYFGELLVKPPFPRSFPFVMSALTIPAPILVLGLVGLGHALVRTVRRMPQDALLLFAALLPVLVIAGVETPKFGGVKHWYNALPAFSILAARALVLAVEAAWPTARRLAVPGLALLAALPGALGIAASHPNGIGFYNELAGGFRGGAELGMQRGFWGGLAGPLYTKGALPSAGSVFFNRTNYDAFRMYQREGTIPRAVGYANDAKNAVAGVAFEQPEHAERTGEIWSSLGTRPVDGVYQDGVTLIQLYTKDRSRGPP